MALRSIGVGEVTFGKHLRLELIFHYVVHVFFKETFCNPYKNAAWYGSFRIAGICVSTVDSRK